VSNWRQERLVDVVEVPTPRSKIKRIEYLSSGKFPIVAQESDLINGWWESGDDVFRVDAPVIVFGDHTRVIKFVDFDFVVGADGVKILRPIAELDARFLFYFLKANPVGGLGYARHFRLLKDLKIPLPPLDEQKRIVAKLDQAQRQIDQLTSNLDLQLAAVGDFGRAAVNEQTNRGHLTAASLESRDMDISPTTEPAVSNWPKVTLGSVAAVLAGQSPEGKFYNKGQSGLPFYQGKKNFGARSLGAPTVWTSSSPKISVVGDIVMSVRAPVGPVNLTNEKCCIGRGLAAIRPKEKLDRDFLFYYLQSVETSLLGSEGAVFSSINRGQIEALLVPLPPLDDQKSIVAKLDDVHQALAVFRGALDEQRSLAVSLRERTLAAAFAGDL
jgi:restriction endonuclease S subunit